MLTPKHAKGFFCLEPLLYNIQSLSLPVYDFQSLSIPIFDIQSLSTSIHEQITRIIRIKV